MRLLKFFLFIVLILNLLWGALVLAGPSLVRSIVKNNFGDYVKLTTVKVSPSLDLTIARAQVTNLNANSLNFSEVIIKSLKFEWSFFSDEQKITVSGRSFDIVNYAVLNEFTLHFNISDLFFGDDIKFFLKTAETSSPKLFNIKKSNLSGVFDKRDHVISGIAYEIFDLSIHSLNIIAGKAHGGLDKFDWGKNLFEQKNKMDLTVDSLFFKEHDLQILKAHSIIENKNGNIAAASDFVNIFATETDVRIDNIIAQTNVAIDEEYSWRQTTKLVLKNLNSASPDLQLPEFTATVFMGDDSIALNSRGTGLSYVVETKNSYLGKLSNLDVSTDVNIRQNNGKVFVDGDLKVLAEPFPDLQLNVLLNSEVDADSSLYSCFNMNCAIDEVNLSYTLLASGEVLSGSSSCKREDCLTAQFNHFLQTTDTDKLFKTLIGTKLISPLPLMFFFSELRKGVPNGAGHEIVF